MKYSDLKVGDILVSDNSWIGRPTVCYVVMGKYAVAFKGDVNCGDRPQGWLIVYEDDPLYCDVYRADRMISERRDSIIRVYRPKCLCDTFNGDFENKEIYDCIYARKGTKVHW